MNEKSPKKSSGEGVLWLLGIILLGCGAILSFQDKTASATATYGAGILCLIFSSLSLFSSFKGLGVEGVLKEKIEEADELIEHLKSFSTPTAKLLISNVARTGRWSSPIPRKESYDLCNEISESMRRTGVSATDIELALKDWYWYNLFDMAIPIFDTIDQFVNPAKDKLQEQINTLPKLIRQEGRDKQSKLNQSKNEIEAWKKEFQDLRQQEDLMSLGDEVENHIRSCFFADTSEKDTFLSKHHETLEDLKYYGKNKEFRRLEAWFSGDK